MNYQEFLHTKKHHALPLGMSDIPYLSDKLFPHQRDVVEFLLKIGRGGAFLDTGLGKTLVELEWAQKVVEHLNKPLIYFCPLAVGKQHAREAALFGYDVKIASDQSDIKGAGIYITNYEKMHKYDNQIFGAIVLDESSILKNYTGTMSRKLMSFGNHMKYRLAATATPAPNDHMELGQHCQFLGVMDSSEMLARWFVADQQEMGRYRLKHYAVDPFWSWVASWARCIGKPSDLGHSDDGYLLPKMEVKLHAVSTDIMEGAGEALFRMPDLSATAIHKEKRITSMNRAEKIAQIVESEPDEYWMIWTETDYDADSIKECLPDTYEVRGSMSNEQKEEILDGFSTGKINRLISKPKIAGMGLNWQHCARTAFVGLSFSYEAYYQAIRRFWRFGQKRQVHCHIALADTEQSIWGIIKRKEQDHIKMKESMFAAMRRETLNHGVKNAYNPQMKMELPRFL